MVPKPVIHLHYKNPTITLHLQICNNLHLFTLASTTTPSRNLPHAVAAAAPTWQARAQTDIHPFIHLHYKHPQALKIINEEESGAHVRFPEVKYPRAEVPDAGEGIVDEENAPKEGSEGSEDDDADESD